MILFGIAVFVGLVGRQKTQYWKNFGFALLSHLAAGLLFHGGGTLANPAGDGVITAMVRSTFNDGPQTIVVLPFAIGFAWILPIYLLKKGYSRARKPENRDNDSKAA